MTYDDAVFLQEVKKQKVITRQVIISLVKRLMRHWAQDLMMSDKKFDKFIDDNSQVAVQYVEDHGIKVVDISG